MSNPPNHPTAPAANQSPESAEHRRGFFVKAAAAIVGAILVVFPFAAGLAVFFSPLTKSRNQKVAGSGNEDGYIRVTSLDAIPADGTPKRFAVITDLDDAWTHYRKVPIGSVYLRRAPDGKVNALSTICPHLGCFVNFDQQARDFKCPCHNSFFTLDGAIIEPSPSPRPMDCLQVKEVMENGTTEISVKYENFYTGIPEQKVKS